MLPSDATKPVDAPIERGIKYTFDHTRKDWVETPIQFRLSKVPIGEGGMRLVYRCDEITPDGAWPQIAKFFKVDVRARDEDYFGEAMAQCMCEEFAQNFNRSAHTPNKVSFLSCYVVRILGPVQSPSPLTALFGNGGAARGRPSTLFILEPILTGTFTKHTSNFGDVYADSGALNETAEAFSHFTYCESGDSMLVCDIQGVESIFTDPQIHTEDGRGLGMGNMGLEGIERWKRAHKCNNICRALKLRAVNATGYSATPPPRLPQAPQDRPRDNRYLQLHSAMEESFVRRSGGPAIPPPPQTHAPNAAAPPPMPPRRYDEPTPAQLATPPPRRYDEPHAGHPAVAPAHPGYPIFTPPPPLAHPAPPMPQRRYDEPVQLVTPPPRRYDDPRGPTQPFNGGAVPYAAGGQPLPVVNGGAYPVPFHGPPLPQWQPAQQMLIHPVAGTTPLTPSSPAGTPQQQGARPSAAVDVRALSEEEQMRLAIARSLELQ